MRVSPLAAIVLGNLLVIVVCSRSMIASPPPDARSWAIVIGLGVVQLGMSYVAYSAGVARVRAVEAVLVATIEPILNPLWVALGTGERPSNAALVGGGIIIASVALQGALNRERKRPRPAATKPRASSPTD
jgi:drug/metabolite transporter (DMT)-like permease